jgi:hypothetical protein
MILAVVVCRTKGELFEDVMINHKVLMVDMLVLS